MTWIKGHHSNEMEIFDYSCGWGGSLGQETTLPPPITNSNTYIENATANQMAKSFSVYFEKWSI